MAKLRIGETEAGERRGETADIETGETETTITIEGTIETMVEIGVTAATETEIEVTIGTTGPGDTEDVLQILILVFINVLSTPHRFNTIGTIPHL